jgi:predicted GH43/DUF377 family glycosyl hydrolase
VLHPAEDSQKEAEWPGGCEDPRIVEAEDGTYILTYTQWDRKVARLAVATSSDLINWEKHGSAFAKEHEGRFRSTWSKSGSIVTQLKDHRFVASRINGLYWMYFGEGKMHLATSNNLRDWSVVLDDAGAPLSIVEPRPGKFDSYLVEPGPPAILTERGIVLLYNGKNGKTQPDPALPVGIYTAGQCLFDPRNPRRLVDRTDTWFLRPDRAHEITGQYTAGTTFIEGLVRWDEKWLLYFGAADSFVGVAVSDQPVPA